MIEAIEIKRNQFVVRSFDPLTGKVWQSATATGEGDAIRLAHTWNRLYIIEKMSRWLHQRAMAFRVTNNDKVADQVLALLDKIVMYSNSSVTHLRAVIASHEEDIKVWAPRESSKQYPFYDKVIRNIVEFCREMEAVPA